MSSRLRSEPGDRHESGERLASRRQKLRAALLGLAVAALAGGSWWAGHSGKSTPQKAGAVPVIRPDSAPVKEAPANPGGMAVSNQDSLLLNHEGKPQPEELLPPPESPAPRPMTPVPAKAAAPPQEAAPAAALASPARAIAAPAHARAVAVASSPKARPPLKNAPAAPAAGSAFRLQLAALRSEAAARREWLRLQREQPDLLGRLSLTVSRVDLGARGVYYRVEAGPFADGALAERRCVALRRRRIGCFVVKP